MRRHRILGLFVVCLSFSSLQAIRAGDAIPVSTPASSIKILMLSNVQANTLAAGFAANEGFVSTLLENQAGAKLSRPITKLRLPAELTLANIAREIGNLGVGQNDTLLCYVSTHGGFDDNGDGDPNSHFFGFPNETVRRTALFSALKAQRARLTILISDSCFSSVDPSLNRPGPSVAAAGQTNALYWLLRYHQGDVDINGASPFHFGLYLGGDLGGVFSRAFWTSSLTASPRGTWPDFFGVLVNQTQREFSTDFPNGFTVTGIAGLVPDPFIMTSQKPYSFPH